MNIYLRFFLAALSGLALVFSFPPFEHWYIAFAAFIPLLLASKEKAPLNFILGVTAGLFFYGPALFWINWAAGPIYILLVVYLSLYWGIFLWTVFSLKKGARIFTAASIWFLLEIIMTYAITGFPWLLMGLSQWKNPYILHLAAYTGIYGLSFIVIAGNFFLFYLFKKAHTYSKVIYILAVSSIILLTVYSKNWHSREDYKQGYLDIMVIQPNITSAGVEYPAESIDILSDYTMRKAVAQRPDIVLWPEGSFPANIDKDPVLFGKLRQMSAEGDFALIFGTFTTAGEDTIYNSAVLIDRLQTDVYNKNHLVPYGEFILGGHYEIISNIFERISGYIPSVEHGTRFNLFSYSEKDIAVIICFENVFPHITRTLVEGGGEVFLVITNDSWFGDSFGPHQHFAHNVLRAVESNKYFVQSSLTGISGIVSPNGEIKHIIMEKGNPLFVQGFFTHSVPVLKGPTFYSANGDITMFVISLILLGVAICTRQKKA